MATNWKVTVTINQDGLGVFKATVDPNSVGPVVDGDTIKWDITEPIGFPADAEVFLQFFKLNGAGKKVEDNGCLKGGNKGKHKGSGNGPKKKEINGDVEAAPHSGKKTHSYLMGYTATMGSGILVDPEIVVDGGNPVKKKKAKKAQPARRPAPKRKTAKKTSAKSAKRAKPAKKAKPTAKPKPKARKPKAKKR